MRTSAAAGIDVVELATNHASPGERGFFTLLEKDSSSPESQDEEKQQKLWTKTLEWSQISRENTALKTGFE